MVTKLFVCPFCKTQMSFKGNPGDRIQVECPSCGKKGIASFPDGQPKTTSEPGAYAIQVNNLSKYYGNRRHEFVKANDSVTFSVKKGEIFGFLGPNGAGKTTAIKSMLRLIYADSGHARINGYNMMVDDIQAKKKIGYLPERVKFYENLTPLQTLNFFCELKGSDKSIVRSLVKEVGLEDAINRKVGTFSKGMVQLLGVAQTMIGNPSIYILDEPMGGLDARWVKTIREKIKMLNQNGATVIFSSHILTEVENLCDRVAIINKGKIIAEDTVANLSKYLKIKPRLSIFIKGLGGRVPEIIRDLEGVESVDAQGDILFVTCEPTFRSKVIILLEEAGYEVVDIKTIEPSLEEAFVKLVSKEEGDA